MKVKETVSFKTGRKTFCNKSSWYQHNVIGDATKYNCKKLLKIYLEKLHTFSDNEIPELEGVADASARRTMENITYIMPGIG